jgi:hypothetical protein
MKTERTTQIWPWEGEPSYGRNSCDAAVKTRLLKSRS